VSGKHRLQIRFALIKRDGKKCKKCGKYGHVHNLTIDHIIPVFLGGNLLDLNNMQLLCRDCHEQKNKKIDWPVHSDKQVCDMMGEKFGIKEYID
jgi:5-methylcytosine-specific restriction endonuclease McrA